MFNICVYIIYGRAVGVFITRSEITQVRCVSETLICTRLFPLGISDFTGYFNLSLTPQGPPPPLWTKCSIDRNFILLKR